MLLCWKWQEIKVCGYVRSCRQTAWCIRIWKVDHSEQEHLAFYLHTGCNFTQKLRTGAGHPITPTYFKTIPPIKPVGVWETRYRQDIGCQKSYFINSKKGWKIKLSNQTGIFKLKRGDYIIRGVCKYWTPIRIGKRGTSNHRIGHKRGL